MLDFPSEQKETSRSTWVIGAIVAAVALAAAAFVLVPKWRLSSAMPKFGQLAVSSQPPGADVFVDGQHRGVTPLTFGLPSGTHSLQLKREDATKTIEVSIKPGVEVMHYVDLEARPAAALPDVGQLLVASDPSGARVTVDGQPRGVTPVTIPTSSPGSTRYRSQVTPARSSGTWRFSGARRRR